MVSKLKGKGWEKGERGIFFVYFFFGGGDQVRKGYEKEYNEKDK